MSIHVHRLTSIACGLLLAGSAIAADDSDSHLFSTFLSAEGSLASTKPGGNDSDADAVADVIFSHKAGPWRFLGELVLSPDEHEVERAQIGYEVADNAVLWVGRFHQPSSVWNVSFHHGQFLQTSITRPAMEAWEDDHGFLPQHIVGGLIESLIPTSGAAAWRFTVAAGLSPRFNETRLKPYVPFRGTEAELGHGSLRLEWLPDALGEDVVGIVASRTKMLRDDIQASSPITLSVAGLFANLGTDRVRALGNITVLDTKGIAIAPLRFRRHVASYLQVETEARPNITLFARQELLSNSRNSAYFALLTAPTVHRTVLGVRAQIGLRNALSLELSRGRPHTDTTLRELRLQWSAAFP